MLPQRLRLNGENSQNDYRGFRKYRIRKYQISGNKDFFGNPLIEIFH